MRSPSTEQWYTSARDATCLQGAYLVTWESRHMTENGKAQSRNVVRIVHARIERAQQERRTE